MLEWLFYVYVAVSVSALCLTIFNEWYDGRDVSVRTALEIFAVSVIPTFNVAPLSTQIYYCCERLVVSVKISKISFLKIILLKGRK